MASAGENPVVVVLECWPQVWGRITFWQKSYLVFIFWCFAVVWYFALPWHSWLL